MSLELEEASSDVTKLEKDVTKCEPISTALQSELLAVGQEYNYPLICLGSSWGGIFLSAGKAGWIKYALSEPERLSIVVPAVRRYCGIMRQYGIAGYTERATSRGEA